VTVSAVQIIAAQAKGLINVTGLAKACDTLKFPFYLAATILDKETDGRNIFGHDKGGAFSDPTGANIEVTEERYREFRRLIDGGMTSNGVGPMQITWKGYFPVMEADGLKPWIPADNILFGVSILAASLKVGLDQGLTLEKAFWNTAKSYNGNASYADDAVTRARTWAVTVGTSDMEVNVADERIPFRGAGLTCRCVVESLPLVEEEMLLRGLISNNIDIYQLGYRDDVPSSSGTHARGFNIDVGQYSDAEIDIWRLHGYNMQHRTRAQGFALEHGHGGPWGCPHGSPAALDQMAQWRLRQNGLISRGPVLGRWPVKDYRDAMVERKKVIMALADDVAKATVAEQIRRGAELGKAIAKGFLTADDIVSAGKDEPDPTNEYQAPKTFVTRDHDLLVDIRDALKRLTLPTP
jgi:hypothetical protein